MKIFFAVPWIEIEYGWGDRPEGYKVYDNIEECITDTNYRSEHGNYDGGYCGPERPLCYIETPDEIEGPFPKFVKNVQFKGERKFLK